MTYTIRYTRTAYHIAGIAERSVGSEFNYAVSACPALSRHGYNMAVGASSENLAEALATAETLALIQNAKMCAKCKAAAETVITSEAG